LNKYADIIKNETEKLKNYIMNNKKLIIIIIFFCILSYGFSICNFTVGVDTEYAISSQSSDSTTWVEQGRFGVGILKKIFSTNQILPFRNIYLAIVLMIINTILLCYVLKPNNKNNNKKNKDADSNSMLSIIMSILYITSPVFIHNLYFTTYNFEIQIGILFCIVSAYMSSKYILDGEKNKIFFILPVLIMTFTVGIYQSFISFYFALICYKIIDYLIELKRENKIMKSGKFIKIAFDYFKIIVISVVLYYIIDKISSVFIPKAQYISQFIGWKTYGFDFVFNGIIQYIKDILVHTKMVGTGIIFYTSLISVLLVVYYFIFKKSLRIYIPLLIGLIMLSPFMLTIALGSDMPYRTQQSLVLITPLIFGVMYQTINNRYLRNIMCLIVVLVGFNQSMYTNKLLYSDYVRYQQDLDLTRQINNKITELGYIEPEKYKVICIGKIETDQTPNIIKQELIGYSIYEWDEGNPKRISAFMRIHGKNYIKVDTDDVDIKKAKTFALDMPIWPNKDCIQLIDNVIVVKLSN